MKSKTLGLMIFALVQTISTLAWSSYGQGEYQFLFTKTKDRFEYSTQAASYEDAFKQAAQACYRHFKNGKPLTEDEGLDIIDVCANPRRI